MKGKIYYFLFVLFIAFAYALNPNEEEFEILIYDEFEDQTSFGDYVMGNGDPTSMEYLLSDDEEKNKQYKRTNLFILSIYDVEIPTIEGNYIGFFGRLYSL